jgi:hypothetical protein
MKITELYNKHIQGEVSREKFIYEVRRDPNFSHWITNLTSYDDAIRILKNKGIIQEAKKAVKELTLDQVNPYEFKKGIEYELGLKNNAISDWGHEFTSKPDYLKCQKKVLTNLAKDPLYYTRLCSGQKSDTSTDMTEVGKKVVPANKASQMKDVKGAKVKSNVKDTLGNKEKAKGKPAKVKEMTMTPKKSKGVKVMEVPKAKGKTIKMESLIPQKKISLSSLLEGLEDLEDPTTPDNSLPYGQVQLGMRAQTTDGGNGKVLAMGDYNKVKQYDTNGAMDDYLKSNPPIDGTQLLAIQFDDNTTEVYPYGPEGVFVSKDELGSINEYHYVNPVWDRMSHDDRMDLLLKYVSDPLEADTYAGMNFDALPDSIHANIYRELSQTYSPANTEDDYMGDPGFEDTDVTHRSVKYDVNESHGDAEDQWDALGFDERFDLILKYVDDPDRADFFASQSFHQLPDSLHAQLQRDLENMGNEYEPDFDVDYGDDEMPTDYGDVGDYNDGEFWENKNEVLRLGPQDQDEIDALLNKIDRETGLAPEKHPSTQWNVPNPPPHGTRLAPNRGKDKFDKKRYGSDPHFFTEKNNSMKTNLKELVKKIYEDELKAAKEKTAQERKDYVMAKKAEADKELQSMNEAEAQFLNNANKKQVPIDEEEKAKAKSAILLTLTKAQLHTVIDLDTNMVIKGDNIWLKYDIGNNIMQSETLKALCSDSKFAGVDPVSQTEISIIFKK